MDVRVKILIFIFINKTHLNSLSLEHFIDDSNGKFFKNQFRNTKGVQINTERETRKIKFVTRPNVSVLMLSQSNETI